MRPLSSVLARTGVDDGQRSVRSDLWLRGITLVSRAPQATECNSKRSPRALVTLRIVDHVGFPSSESAL